MALEALQCGVPCSRCCSAFGSWQGHCSRCCRSETWWQWRRSCWQGAAARWQVCTGGRVRASKLPTLLTHNQSDDIVALHHVATEEAEDLARIMEPFLEAAPVALVGNTAESGALPVQHLQASLRWRTVPYRRLRVAFGKKQTGERHNNRTSTGNPFAAACFTVRYCGCMGTRHAAAGVADSPGSAAAGAGAV